jgi:hypothetical protein
VIRQSDRQGGRQIDREGGREEGRKENKFWKSYGDNSIYLREGNGCKE